MKLKFLNNWGKINRNEIHSQIVAALFFVAAVSAAPTPNFPVLDTFHHITSYHAADPILSSAASDAAHTAIAAAVSGATLSAAARSYDDLSTLGELSVYPYVSHGAIDAYANSAQPAFWKLKYN